MLRLCLLRLLLLGSRDCNVIGGPIPEIADIAVNWAFVGNNCSRKLT